MVQSPADAALYSGRFQSVVDGIGVDGILADGVTPAPGVYGVDSPTQGLPSRLPTAADALGNPNFLEGGITAVALPDNGGYLVNPTRELVRDGSVPMPSGSQLNKVGNDGTRTIIRTW